MSCWNPRVEMMPGDELHGLQLKLLKSLVYRLYSFSPFYRERMDAAHVSPDDIKTLEDVEKLPFMVKGDLRDNTDGQAVHPQREGGPIPRLLRDHRKIHHGRLHQA